MSDIEIYTIAKVARAKLLSEYHVKDHDLHKLVAHANLYDNLLNVYYKQEEPGTNRAEKQQHAPTTRQVTFDVPAGRLPIRGRDERKSESEKERRKSSLARKEDVKFCEGKLVSDINHLESSQESAEVTIVEMKAEDDG